MTTKLKVGKISKKSSRVRNVNMPYILPFFLYSYVCAYIINKFASAIGNAKAFAEAYLCFSVSALAKKMPRQLNA